MKILLSNSDLHKQLKAIEEVHCELQIVFVDAPFELEVNKEALTISQGDQTIRITAVDTLVFLLFREPHERGDEEVSALELNENFALLADACDMLGSRIVNHPECWRRSYSKIALFRIARSYPKLVPATVLLNGKRKSSRLPEKYEWIAKSGFGIKRPIEGLTPRYGVVTTEQFEPQFSYRYLLQQYIESQSELRVYVTRSVAHSEATIIEMPTGTRSAPDWRDTTITDQLHCSVVLNQNVSDLALELATQLQLESISFDFLYNADQIFLIDINPHGSWYWLPRSSRDRVERQMVTWFRSL